MKNAMRAWHHHIRIGAPDEACNRIARSARQSFALKVQSNYTGTTAWPFTGFFCIVIFRVSVCRIAWLASNVTPRIRSRSWKAPKKGSY
jgi:hypothetical protein